MSLQPKPRTTKNSLVGRDVMASANDNGPVGGPVPSTSKAEGGGDDSDGDQEFNDSQSHFEDEPQKPSAEVVLPPVDPATVDPMVFMMQSLMNVQAQFVKMQADLD